MKALQNMDTIEKGKLLADLFPEQLPTICNYIAQQTSCFLNNEDYIRDVWESTTVTANFWFGIVKSTTKVMEKYGVKFQLNSQLFSYHLFDGYKELLTIYCLISYAGQEECNYNLQQAIYLFFGDVTPISITLKCK